MTIGRRRLLGLVPALAMVGCQTGPVPLNRVDPPPPPQVPLARVAFTSCADQSKPQPIWDTLYADRPDLVIFGGDNVYASPQQWTPEALRTAYQAQAAIPGFARVRRSFPHLAIWDDHDYGLNDGGADFVHKQASKDLFLEFWEAGEKDPRRSHEGIYHAEVFGPPGQRVQVILLDTRWFRSAWKRTDVRDAPGKERYLPDEDPAKSMLGAQQWSWLEAQLKQPADVRLIVSGVQVVVDGHGWERWGNFPLERSRLYKLVAATGAGGVVFLSGDRHIGAIYREARDVPYPLYELTSSGVTHPWAQASEAGPNRIGALFTEQHYGTVEIDWAARVLRLELKDLRGAVRRSQAIAMDQLQPKQVTR
ncbi:MAG: alkaline phosphatase family protein [Burkholderiales bacterium]|nr:alkaline phosphatase family protein [Burkholderiales bacterium]